MNITFLNDEKFQPRGQEWEIGFPCASKLDLSCPSRSSGISELELIFPSLLGWLDGSQGVRDTRDGYILCSSFETNSLFPWYCWSFYADHI
jgi:hypothetical protein